MDSWVGKIHWRRDRLPTPLFLGFPGGSAGKKSACNVRDLGLIPELGKSPGEGKGYLLRYSGLENSIDCICHGVAKSQTQLRNFHFPNCILGIWTKNAAVFLVGFLKGRSEERMLWDHYDLI